ncbi:MAG: hypothetical protein K2L04_08880 [Alistipes sp.]|nr:hypothetical protein [Alistipes sp.]
MKIENNTAFPVGGTRHAPLYKMAGFFARISDGKKIACRNEMENTEDAARPKSRLSKEIRFPNGPGRHCLPYCTRFGRDAG